MNRLFSLRRLMAIITKEAIQMRRDRITFAMMLGVPLMQLVLFGFAINNDPKGLPAALVTTSQDHYTRAMVSAMENTGYYRFDHVVASAEEADRLIKSGAVSFVVTVPSDFARRVQRGDHPQILIEADATDPSVASGAISTLGTVAAQALLREQSAEAQAAEQSTAALNVVVHQLYNPEGITQYNIVPGLLGVILQLTMVMMTSMALTRETERGTMENLLAMPASPLEIMLGKVLPFLVVGGVQVLVVLVAAKTLFGVPFVGSLWLLLVSILIFVLALVLLGYAFSTLARTQMQAMQLTFFFFLPSLLLSGFMFPFRGMPAWAQRLARFSR
jgi:ABC-2 type transport system permease protein